MLGLRELVFEAMKVLGYAVRNGFFAWLRWHREEPCDAWVYHAAMYALTPRKRKRARKWHANLGRRSLARCVAKRIREGKIPPRIDGNPARWLEVHHQAAAQRVITECDREIAHCRDLEPSKSFDQIVHMAATRMRDAAPRFVERDDTPIDEVPT